MKSKEFWHSKAFILNTGIFNVDIVVSINQTRPQIQKYLQKISGKNYPQFPQDQLNEWDDNDINLGRMIPFRGGFVILIKAEKNKFRHCLGTLTHEIIHTSHYLLRQRRIPLKKSTEEVYAYLTEYLITQALLKLY